MTNNKKIELCKKAYKNYKRDVIKEALDAWLTITIEGLMYFMITYNFYKSGIDPTIGCKILSITGLLLLGFFLIYSLIIIFVSRDSCKTFVILINMREFEIVKQKINNEKWYCMRITDSNRIVRAEKILNDNI